MKHIILLVTLIVFGLAAPVYGEDSGNGIMEGQIINGTSGGGSVAGITVNLNISREGTALSTSVAQVDAAGKFVFQGLATGATYSYDVVAFFRGIDYRSAPVTISENETSASVQVMVYEPTGTDAAISVALAHTIVYPREGAFLIKEYYLFTNGGDRTYVGPAPGSANGTLLFSLPADAFDLQASIGSLELISGNRFADTLPVRPGMHEVAYSYQLNGSLSGFIFDRRFNYDTVRYDFLVPGDFNMESDQLAADESLDISGTRFAHLSGGDFPSGASLAVRLSGTAPATDRSALWLALTGAAILAAAAIVFIFIIRNKRRTPAVAGGSPERLRARLLDEIAELDDKFEDGSIKEEYYRKLRDAKKAELVELTRRQKGG